jgi:hypothetical protein
MGNRYVLSGLCSSVRAFDEQNARVSPMKILGGTRERNIARTSYVLLFLTFHAHANNGREHSPGIAQKVQLAARNIKPVNWHLDDPCADFS